MKWEFEDGPNGFRHRITDGDTVGEWANYESIATLDKGRKHYIAVTDCYLGVLHTKTVLEVSG